MIFVYLPQGLPGTATRCRAGALDSVSRLFLIRPPRLPASLSLVVPVPPLARPFFLLPLDTVLDTLSQQFS